MRKITEVLRLKWDLRFSNRDIAASINISTSTVSECIKRAAKAGLSWPLPEGLDEEKLEQMLYVANRNKVPAASREIDYVYLNQELKNKGVTLQLLWYEYKSRHPDGLSYSQYCNLYREWSKQANVYMRQPHKAGEKMFVDYAGMTIPIVINIDSGETHEAQIFVSALGASNYTYTEATWSQSLPDWIGSHTRSFTYFGGVPEVVVPDNLKAGVHKSHRYEPDLNPTYQDMAQHYDIAVIPARVATPKDKPKVEQAVQNVERWILAKLRHRTFFNLYELNQAIKPLLEELNRRPFQKLPGSRQSQFEALEKPALRPLPQVPYVYAEWQKMNLGLDYHVKLDNHYYSAPFTLAQKSLNVRYTQNIVEIFYRGKRVASHRRSYQKEGCTTLPEHMPKSHRLYAEWTPVKILNQMKEAGEAATLFAEKIITTRKQHGLQSCLGIIRLTNGYGKERINAACKRAAEIGAFSYKSIESILRNNLDQNPTLFEQIQLTTQAHENVRGGDYFK